MFTRIVSMVSIVAATAAVAVPASAVANAPSKPSCSLLAHRITSVRPYRVDERLGRTSLERLRGAEIFVQAERGLTAEWLQLVLARHITQMRGSASMPDCVFDVDDVTVRVDPGGSGFLVRIIAPDADKAREVLRRARLLVS